MKVYATRKNGDMNEGRGPMVIDKVFLHRKHAEEYIDDKPGIMGRQSDKGWSNEKYGDWDIEEWEVLEYSLIDMEKEEQRLAKNAKSKLSNAEYKALLNSFQKHILR